MKEKTISKAIPIPMPKDMLEAYDYSKIATRALDAQKIGDEKTM